MIKSDRSKPFITLQQICIEFYETFEKLSEITIRPEYNNKAQFYSNWLLDTLAINRCLSWQQFDSIWPYVRTKAEYFKERKQNTQIYQFKNIINIRRGPLVFTYKSDFAPIDRIRTLSDRQLDRLYEKLFGFKPTFDEEKVENFKVNYDQFGYRYFSIQ